MAGPSSAIERPWETRETGNLYEAAISMKTVGLRFSTYRWERPRPIHNGLFTYSEANVGLVEIETDEGITGFGLTTDPLISNGNRIIAETIRTLAPVILDIDPLRTERIWADLWRPKLIGRRGLTTRAISAVDIALWDIKAKAAGQPLDLLLGGYRDRIPAYVAGGYYEEGKGITELVAEVSGYVDLGARALKMKIGGLRIRKDVERVEAVRDAVGPDIDIMLDANGAYTVFDAIRIARSWNRWTSSGSKNRSIRRTTRGWPGWRGARPSPSRPGRTSTPNTVSGI